MLRYRVEPADRSAHLFRVSLTLPRPEATVVLRLPVWIPGSYLIREFARHLSEFEARQGELSRVVTALDKARWQVDECDPAQPLELSWQVYAFDTSVRTAYLDERRAFFNGTSLFPVWVGHEHEPHQVELACGPGGWPEDWQVATGMDPVDCIDSRRWQAANYDELVDHPFELGDFWRCGFEVEGVPHDLVVSGAGPQADLDRLLIETRQICAEQIRFWHGEGQRPPFERYVFLLNVVQDGYGGLEHRASTALLASRKDLPRRAAPGANPPARTEGHVTLLGLISHEYFHTWNVKRLRPQVFAPYALDREAYTGLLWFYEGFTSYYDDLILLRCGLIDPATYLKLLTKTVQQVLATPGRRVQSLSEASFDAWIKYYRPDENTANATVSYYTKGSLVALALDLALRATGVNGATLDALMRRLWQRSAAAEHRQGTEEADIRAALADVAGPTHAPALLALLDAAIHRCDELPLPQVLAQAGIDWQAEPGSWSQRLGLRLSEAGGALKVQSVARGGAAEAAGVSAGDEWLALGDWRVRQSGDAEALGVADQPLALLCVRDQRVLHLTLPAVSAEVGPQIKLLPLAEPDESALALRRVWLGA
jgi:predicted metalloprotease with PDZ domain